MSNKTERAVTEGFDTYKISFAGTQADHAAFTALWDKLTEPVMSHVVTMPDLMGKKVMVGYFADNRYWLNPTPDELEVKGEGYLHRITTSLVCRTKR